MLEFEFIIADNFIGYIEPPDTAVEFNISFGTIRVEILDTGEE